MVTTKHLTCCAPNSGHFRNQRWGNIIGSSQRLLPQLWFEDCNNFFNYFGVVANFGSQWSVPSTVQGTGTMSAIRSYVVTHSEPYVYVRWLEMSYILCKVARNELFHWNNWRHWCTESRVRRRLCSINACYRYSDANIGANQIMSARSVITRPVISCNGNGLTS